MVKKTFREEIGSRHARDRLDGLIEDLNAGSEPFVIRGNSGAKAVLMSFEDFDMVNHTLNLLNELAHGGDLAEFVRESRKPVPEERKIRPLTTEYIHVYQFSLSLAGIDPPIWRRIVVPGNYTFWDLHVAIQDAMGWADMHLHEFEIVHPRTGLTERIGVPEAGADWGSEPAPGWIKEISRYFTPDHSRAVYLYDFGDEWRHTVKLEKIRPRARGKAYPECTGGGRACPPEDCGGPWGYGNLISIASDPAHHAYPATMEWLGGSFDPEDFDPGDVEFDDPRQRLSLVLPEGG